MESLQEPTTGRLPLRWSELGYRIEITGDGSPTLRLLEGLRDDFPEGEAMHHSGGAAEETDLIYGTCIREALKENQNPHFLIVGLGLGYIEMYLAKEALLGNFNVGDVCSLESSQPLRSLFLAWLREERLSPEIQETYDLCLEFVLQGSVLEPEAVKALLKQDFHSCFNIQSGLDARFQARERFHAILYDAFSGKTSPELWEEEFLNDFLEKTTAPQARVATYACRGSLKRALRRQNFEVVLGPGFHGKRKYTLGIRKGVLVTKSFSRSKPAPKIYSRTR